MAKKRTLNEIRQEKNYGYTAPSKTIDKEIDKQEQKDELEVAKDLIVNKIIRHLPDVIFENTSRVLKLWIRTLGNENTQRQGLSSTFNKALLLQLSLSTKDL